MRRSPKEPPPLKVVTPPEDQGPPRNIEIERQVLGATMRDAEAVLPVILPILAGVAPFWLADHETIYQAIRELHGQGQLIDPFTVMDALQLAGELERVGGLDALTGMVHSIATVDNAKHWAEILRSKAIKRDLYRKTRDLSDAILAERDTADALRAMVMASLASVPSEVVGGAEGYATLSDALAVIGDTRWLWDGWIAQGVLNLLSAKGGLGKTRTAMDLARRLWFGLPMPDGQPNSMPAGTKTLWLFVDRNWGAAGDVARSFGLPTDAVLLPTSKDRPIHTPELDDPATLVALEHQIREQQPGMVVIDTITYATSYKTGQADEAKAAFDGLMNLAARTGVAILALTHTNKDGETLGRRIEERARVNMHLVRPDTDQPHRLRFWVEKSEAKKPPALGITLLADRNDYDEKPPVAPDPERKSPGPSPTKSRQDAEWLVAQLEAFGHPVMLAKLIDTARTDGVLKAKSLSPLYNAKDRVPSIRPGFVVSELEMDGPSGKTFKYWHLELDIPAGTGDVDSTGLSADAEDDPPPF